MATEINEWFLTTHCFWRQEQKSLSSFIYISSHFSAWCHLEMTNFLDTTEEFVCTKLTSQDVKIKCHFCSFLFLIIWLLFFYFEIEDLLLELNDAAVTKPFPKKMPDFDILPRCEGKVWEKHEDEKISTTLALRHPRISDEFRKATRFMCCHDTTKHIFIDMLSWYYYTHQYRHKKMGSHLLHQYQPCHSDIANIL